MKTKQQELMAQIESLAAGLGLEVSTYPVGARKCVVSMMDDSQIPDSLEGAMSDAGIVITYSRGYYPNLCEFAGDNA